MGSFVAEHRNGLADHSPKSDAPNPTSSGVPLVHLIVKSKCAYNHKLVVYSLFPPSSCSSFPFSFKSSNRPRRLYPDLSTCLCAPFFSRFYKYNQPFPPTICSWHFSPALRPLRFIFIAERARLIWKFCILNKRLSVLTLTLPHSRTDDTSFHNHTTSSPTHPPNHPSPNTHALLYK